MFNVEEIVDEHDSLTDREKDGKASSPGRVVVKSIMHSGATGEGEAQIVKKELVCIVSKDESMRGMRVQWGAGIVGHVALTLKSLNIRGQPRSRAIGWC